MIDALRQIAREAAKQAVTHWVNADTTSETIFTDVADAVVDALLPCQHQTFRANNFVE